MGDHLRQNTMNLDLNLEPVVHPPQDDHPHTISFQDWILGSVREVVSNRPTSRQQLPSVWRHIHVPIGGTDNGLATDEINNAGNGRDEPSPLEMIKMDEKSDKSVENGVLNKVDVEKSNGDEGSFFDCNICLELASEPVVTCCGHLFCWPCLYRWLFVHSSTKECPICKGEVTMKTITPIYGRANHTNESQVVDSGFKIPSRPQANRIETWRDFIQRNLINMPMFEMIQRHDHNRFDQNHGTGINNPQEFLNRIFTSRGMRRWRDTPPINTPDAGGSNSALLYRRSDHSATLPSLISARNSSGSYIESYFDDHPNERNQEQHLLMEDQHSMSSIAAIIQSESLTADNAAETDSRVSVSTVRRRCESSTSRVSDVDSGEYRSQRRRLQ